MSEDDFADVREMVNGLGAGILAGEGVEDHNKVRSKLAQDGSGFDYFLRCDHCGRKVAVTVPWGELIIMSQGALPGNNHWRHDGRNGCFAPSLPCSNCGDPLRLGLTPDECARNIKSGIAAQKITPQAIQQFLAGPRR